MPSVLHEALIDLFRSKPRLALELICAAQGLEPPARVEISSTETDLGQVVPPEYRADACFLFTGDWHMSVILEAQLRIDPQKRRVWTVYAAVQHARYGCLAAVVVLTLDQKTAEWAAQPIQFGPDSWMRPVVIGPEQIPRITQAEAARQHPELAVLSAIAHGQEPEAAEIAVAAIQGLRGLDADHCRLYTDLILSALHQAARTFLESFMIENWEPQSEFLRTLDAKALERGFESGLERGIEKGIETGIEKGIETGIERGIKTGLQLGRVEGERSLLLRQLRRRFGDLPEPLLARIQQADSPDLERWSEDLLSADSLLDLFGPP